MAIQTTQVLATFRIDKDLWQQFQDIADSKGHSASFALKEYVIRYVESMGNALPSGNQIDIDAKLEALIDAKIASKLAVMQSQQAA